MFKVSDLFRLLFAAAMPRYAFDPKDSADMATVQEMIDAAVEPLKTHNKKLLGELKVAKKGAEIDPAEFTALETERDSLAAQVADLGKQLKTATTAAEAAGTALKGEQGYTNKLLVSEGLNAALLANGVTNPVHLKAAAAMIREGGAVEVKVEGENRVAVIGGKPLADFVKDWSLSDDGKAFVAAPVNGGGGAPGGGKGSVADPFAKDTFNLTEQGKLFKENPTLAAQMQAAAAGTT